MKPGSVLLGYGADGPAPLIQILTELGLTGGLKLCLDAGDINSWPGSGQKWLDTSGGGYDFYRGAGSGAEGSDPTFNGTPGGLSANEYWSSDGGDFFTYDSANEAWMNNLHKNNAIGTIFAVIYPVAGNGNWILATQSTLSETGIQFSAGSDDTWLSFSVVSGTLDVSSIGATEPVANNWNSVAVSWDEAATGFFWLNGSHSQVSGSDTWAASYAAPSGGNATDTLTIGALGGGLQPMVSGSRLACVAVWEGTRLLKGTLDDLWSRLKGRYGL